MAINGANKIVLAGGSAVVYLLILVIYRLYFSPLSRFPGPKIAAITSLYAYYHDVTRVGKYVWVIEDMHKKYGPIVRVRPDVIHINDPEYIDQVYGGAGKRRDKYKTSLNAYSSPGSALGSGPHDLHRSRRAAMNPYFSKQSIRRLEPILQRNLAKILDRLGRNARSGNPLKMNMLYIAATHDIINEYSFGESTGDLDQEDMNEPFFRILQAAAKAIHFGAHVPIWIPMLRKLPTGIALFLNPRLKAFLKRTRHLREQIEYIRNSKELEFENTPPTIFHGLLSNPNLPESEKTTPRLLDEARIVVRGGTDTTALTLACITYQLLANPKILRRLKDELQKAIPDPSTIPNSLEMEKLPYLTAVIQEGVRRHPGVSIRQDRVAPDEDLIYEDRKSGKKYIIERGTAMGMTAPLLSKNEEIWPSPNEFRPERFLENPKLTKYLLTFSRGTRGCIGINLAYSEMYLVLAGIFRKYDLYDGTGNQKCPTLELFETSRVDVDMASDLVASALKEGSQGVRVMPPRLSVVFSTKGNGTDVAKIVKELVARLEDIQPQC